MALTWTNDYESQPWTGLSGQVRYAKAVAASADYATGGYTITPGTFGLQSIRNFTIAGVDSASSSTTLTAMWLWSYNHATGKLQVWGTGTASGDAFNEAAASTDLSGFTIRVVVTGY
jgi:hypothetical protein